MVHESLWLVFPIALSWLIQKLFHNVFHPALSKRDVTSEGKNELNPYFNVAYAASPYKKQKDGFLKTLYSIMFPLYAIIVLPTFWIDNPIDHVLDGEIKFSASWKLSASILCAMYISELVWNELDDTFLACHHIAAILSVFVIVTDSGLLPTGLVFIRASTIPFQDWFPSFTAALYRFNWVENHTFWQKFRAYHYVVANLCVFAIEWLYLIYFSEENNAVVYMCILSWELTELWGMYLMRDFVKNLPQIIKKKIERETKYMTELDGVKEDPCGGESPDTVSDVQVEVAVLD